MISFINFSHSIAQDTLLLPVPSLGHEKYVLYDNGTFLYSSHLCGYSYFALGDYKKNAFGYLFKYDSSRCPSSSIIQIKNEFYKDSIKFSFYSMYDSSITSYYGTVSIGEQQYKCSSNALTVSKNTLKSTNLELIKTSFQFDTSCSEIKIYFGQYGLLNKCGINEVKKLKKTRKGYLHKFKVRDTNKKKPWKKGKKRTIKHYYQIRMKTDNDFV